MKTDSDPQLVRVELDKILSSQTFAQWESLKRFLRHVVERKLEGRAGELKELSIGSDVFERGDSYDPRIDPIVRVQATRLRTKLRDYYQGEGSTAELRIDLPKGSYVPTFVDRSTEKEHGLLLPHAGIASRWRRLWPVFVLTFLVAAFAALLWLVGPLWNRSTTTDAGALRSILVLPFADMSPDHDYEYYGDGLADEITTTLAGIPDLDVVPRTSAFRFKSAPQDMGVIAAELGADAVLQGSVRSSGETLRVAVQLIRASDGKQLWAETYDRPAADAFTVQSDIAQSVARTVSRNLAAPASGEARYVPAPGAYEDYLRGQFEREKNTPLSLARSVGFFEQTLQKDPDFAPAYAGLLRTYILNLLWGFDAPADTREQAREVAERALTLSRSNPEGLSAAASFQLFYERDLSRTEEILNRGRGESGKGSGDLHLVRGLLFEARGQMEEATRELEEAERHLHGAPIPRHLLAAVAFQRGDYEDARSRARAILIAAPDYPLTWLLLSRVEDKLGNFDDADTALATFEKSAEGTALALAARSVLLAHEGREAEAREHLRKLEELSRARYVPGDLLARALTALGENDRALAELERAARERTSPLLFLAVDPDFEPLRGDPRYRALLPSGTNPDPKFSERG
jgi:TolB-like protein/tetratricopeptide (TPR) repeat protein